MTSVIIAIIGVLGIVIGAGLAGWYNQRIERNKQLAQLASDALIDAVDAISASAHGNQAEALAKYASAKARLVVYGNSEAVSKLAEIERNGGLKGSTPYTQELLPQIFLAIRKDNFPLTTRRASRANEVTKEDVQYLLFGRHRAG